MFKHKKWIQNTLHCNNTVNSHFLKIIYIVLLKYFFIFRIVHDEWKQMNIQTSIICVLFSFFKYLKIMKIYQRQLFCFCDRLWQIIVVSIWGIWKIVLFAKSLVVNMPWQLHVNLLIPCRLLKSIILYVYILRIKYFIYTFRVTLWFKREHLKTKFKIENYYAELVMYM